jgi:hypothetical protein
MRATIAHSSDAAQDASLNITYAVLYNVGFFSLLYSSYILVLDRSVLSHTQPMLRPDLILSAQTVDAPPVLPPRLVSVMQNRNLMRIVLVAAVALGIIGAIKLFNAKNQSDINSANSNRDASVYIFLAITVLLAVQLLLVVRDSFSSKFFSARIARNYLKLNHCRSFPVHPTACCTPPYSSSHPPPRA